MKNLFEEYCLVSPQIYVIPLIFYNNYNRQFSEEINLKTFTVTLTDLITEDAYTIRQDLSRQL